MRVGMGVAREDRHGKGIPPGAVDVAQEEATPARVLQGVDEPPQSGGMSPIDHDGRVVGRRGAVWTGDAAASLSGLLQQHGRLAAALNGIRVQIRGESVIPRHVCRICLDRQLVSARESIVHVRFQRRPHLRSLHGSSSNTFVQ